MTDESKLLGSSAVSANFSITLTKVVREMLNIKSGEILGYYNLTDNKIMLSAGKLSGNSVDGALLIGSSTLTKSNNSTLPKKVRQFFKLNVGDYIAFYKGQDENVYIQL